jgi:UDP:flavonoid glycosyltransferase YjiC (YdhE family)
MSHLVVSISGHGFGHVAQTAPILNVLHERMPQLHITVRSAVPLVHLRSRIHAPFTHLSSEGDIGMVMSSALDVRVEESREAYRAFHANWDARVADEARLLRELKADLVFSNVGYLSLAGAQHAGIPNAALCSLNWADIYRHYCNPVRLEFVEGHRVNASTGSARTAYETIAAQIHDCYANADTFLRATPGMSMTNLPNLLPVAPIAVVGTNRRDELNRRLKLSADEKLVLISMGGIASRLPVEKWLRIDGVRWLVQNSWQVEHPDAIILETLQMSFSDLLASSDALICKPGYGSFVEAASCGVPVLYVSRADWPESSALIAWLQQHGLCREVSRDVLEQGMIAAVLKEIWNSPRRGPVTPEGSEQVANWLAGKFGL